MCSALDILHIHDDPDVFHTQAAVVTLHTSTTADVLAHVRAYTLVIGASPMYAQGMRQTDATALPFSSARIQEV